LSDRLQIIRVVVASPSDTTQERAVVARVLEDLNRSVAADRELHLRAVCWETDAYPGFHPDGPQGLIDPVLRITDADLVVGIFWKRFGTPTASADSGTEHELRLAYHAWQQHGRPQLMVYFNTKAWTPRTTDDAKQIDRLIAFKHAFPKEGLWWEYRGAAQFERHLRNHLTNFLRSSTPAVVHERGGAPQLPGASSNETDAYFRVQKTIIDEYGQAFVGRDAAQAAVDAFLNTQPRGYFIVVGGPGLGKTALSCHFVRTRGYVHHLISSTGGRAEPELILRSLVAQLLPLTRRTTSMPATIPELTKLWEELLSVAASTGPVVTVIDGVDELFSDSIDAAPYLPTSGLPRGAYLLVTTRPGDLLDSLEAHVALVPHRVYELEPLAAGEVEDLIRLRAPDAGRAAVTHIVDAAQGNPLYVRAVLDQLTSNSDVNWADLPRTLEGFLRRATRHLRERHNAILRSVLGFLTVVRKPLTIEELQTLTGTRQRELEEQGIAPLRHFLMRDESGYWFYHASFREFAEHTLLYPDEVKDFHARLARHVASAATGQPDYQWLYLGYHLSAAGDTQHLLQSLSPEFLREKARRFGFAVLDDLEFVSRALIESQKPESVEQCVRLVEDLRHDLGDALITNAPLQPRGIAQQLPGGPDGVRVITPRVSSVSGVDVYVGMIPASAVSADFVEIVPCNGGLGVAIGDAPSSGLKSAFVARFLGNYFQNLVKQQRDEDMGTLLEQINSAIAPSDYFERVSMQCLFIEANHEVVRIANAGHPDLVLYSARRGSCDLLTVPGELLHDSTRYTRRVNAYDEYLAEVGGGDVLVLLTDGLLEAHRLMGEPYGYRFTTIVEQNAHLSARDIGERIILDFLTYTADVEHRDDVTLAIIRLSRPNDGSLG
jgi:hypothetical protein